MTRKIPYTQRIGKKPVGVPYRSTYGGTCRRCGKSYKVGDLIQSRGRGQGANHSICLRPQEIAIVANKAAAWAANHDFAHYVQLRESASARDRKLVKMLHDNEALPQADGPDDQEGAAVADD